MRLNYRLISLSKNMHRLINGCSKIPLLAIIVIVLALFVAWHKPSFISLTLFLISLSLTGYNFVGLFTKIFFVQLMLAPLVGFSIIVFSLLVPFATMEKIPMEVRSYLVSIIIGVNLVFAILHFFKKKNQKFTSDDSVSNVMEIHMKDPKIVLLIFLVALLVRLLFQSYNSSSILPDASLYFSAGRSIAERSEFSANVLNDAPITSPYTRVYGLIPRAGTWIILGSFFSFGGVSFATYKLMLVIFGSLMVFPAILLHRLWVGKKYWITGILVAFHPTLLFFSAFPFGPELLSAMFSLSAVALLEFSRVSQKEHWDTFLLVGVLLGVSTIIWEPLFVILILAPYSIFIGFIGKKSISGSVFLLISTIALEATILYSYTWQFNPLVFMGAMLFCSVLIRKRNKELSYRLLIFVSIGLFFFLFLSRWYLYPELVIEPSLNYARRAELINYSPIATSFERIYGSVSLYCDLSTQAYSQFILILGLLSLIVQPWKILRRSVFAYLLLLTHFIVLIFMLGPGRGMIQDYGATRFFLVTAVIFVIIASGVVEWLSDILAGKIEKVFQVKKLKVKFSKLVFSSSVKTIFMVFIIIIELLPGLLEFYEEYNLSLNYGHAINYPKMMGVLDSMDWIYNNTSKNDVFLVASGQTAHVWSMAIDERYFASLIVVKNETIVPFNEIEMSDILVAARKINASYVIFDPMLKAFSLEKLKPIYDQLSVQDVGKVVPVIPENASLNSLFIGDALQGLKTLFVSDRKDSKVIIFEPVQICLKPLWYDDFQNLTNWKTFLNSTMSLAGENLILTTSLFCKEVYAEHVFEDNVIITNKTIVILSVSMQDHGAISGFYIKFKQGKSIAMTFEKPGIYAISIGQFEGFTPQVILLYNILSSNIAFANNSYNVSYDYLFLADLCYQRL